MSSISVWTYPRASKHLLVLDIDHTLADFNLPINAEDIEIFRKHLDYFLVEAYKNYDIVIWSGTSMESVMIKLTCMNLLDNPKYKILFALDKTSMVPVNSMLHGKVMVKPLSVIWEAFPQYNELNTIMIDDSPKNFYCNPRNGLEIASYFRNNYDADEELFALSMFLENLAESTNFSMDDLKNWKYYIQIV